MNRLRRRRVAPGLPILLILLQTGCASAGPDLNGPDGATIMAAYSGSWVLDPSRSEDLNAKMRESMRSPGAGGRAGGMPGGGRRPGGGGIPGGGGVVGRRPGAMPGARPGAGMDPEEMRRAMEAMRELAQAPGEISLVLRPETVGLTENAADALSLTFGADKEEILQAGATLWGSARWTKEGIEIKREMEMRGGVKDLLDLDEEGNLVLEREIDLMGRTVKGTLLYQRDAGEG